MRSDDDLPGVGTATIEAPAIIVTATVLALHTRRTSGGGDFNQAPPLPVEETAVKLKLALVLLMFKFCPAGLAALNALEKERALNCVKTEVPTITVTGIVTLPVADWNRSWPVKFPAISPIPGRAETTTPTETVEGAVAVSKDGLSHAPPSAVVAVTVQVNAPNPVFRS